MMSGEQLVHVTSEPHAGRDDNDDVSHTRSKSERRCEDSTTLTPWQDTTVMRSCRNSRLASGSRLPTGSSSTNSSGCFAMANVRASWA